MTEWGLVPESSMSEWPQSWFIGLALYTVMLLFVLQIELSHLRSILRTLYASVNGSEVCGHFFCLFFGWVLETMFIYEWNCHLVTSSNRVLCLLFEFRLSFGSEDMKMYYWRQSSPCAVKQGILPFPRLGNQACKCSFCKQWQHVWYKWFNWMCLTGAGFSHQFRGKNWSITKHKNNTKPNALL